ncbi:lipopolysaccharide biosynthesis protein [Shewanella sp. 4_MG-2023]|uniref:lipopolysaccharide biosynthesis protein n=1 Tax=Shewanella sp. 4_MG-2023 TaxID=3062652 RepID=UPI0026E475A9|nr:lipopolysaccharide biosynthesis protein [Shewanella sp. 4_MG-2023]MDO6678462.1 lipopolysaccharide biosynthesis protein [Shewanella sp. 4_MG-2023]
MSIFIRNLAKGAKWTAIEKILNQLSKFLVIVILARLLTPEDFGLVAIVLFFVLIAESFISAGFTHAYINADDKGESEERLFSNLIFLNFIVGVIASLILICLSSTISQFYGDERIGLVVTVLAFLLIFDSISYAIKAKLEKKLQFDVITKINIPVFIISSLFAVLYAWSYEDYWALVIQQIIYKIFILFFYIKKNSNSKFEVNHINKEQITYLYHYGWKLQLATTLNTTSKEMNTLLIASSSGVGTAGIYSRANNLQVLIIQTIVNVIEKVTFPLLSELNRKSGSLIPYFRKSNKIFALLIYPILAIVFINSDSIIKIIFGSGWIQVSDLLKILIISGGFRFLQSSNLTFLKVIGRTDLILKLRITECISVITFLFVGLNWGIKGLVLAQTLSTICNWLIVAKITSIYSTYTIYQQASDVSKYLISALVAFVLVMALIEDFDLYFIFEFILSTIIYISLYLICLVIFKVPEIKYIYQYIKAKFK